MQILAQYRKISDIEFNYSIGNINNSDQFKYKEYKLNNLFVQILFTDQIPSNYILLEKDLSSGNKFLFFGEMLLSTIEFDQNILKFLESNDDKVIYEALSKLNGTWVIFIDDKKNNRLLVIRDSIGIFNLYYAETNDYILISTSLIKLKELTGYDKINNEAIFNFLHFLYIPSPTTIYEKINSLKPGTSLSCTRNDIRIVESAKDRFLERNIDPITPFTESELIEFVEEYEKILIDSIERRIISISGRVGIYLSGGKDSSSIAIAASKVNKAKFDCLTIGFSNKSNDESNDAEIVARSLGLGFKKFIFNDYEYYNWLNEYVKLHEQPFLDISGLPVTIATHLLKDQYELYLDGTGNDYYLGIKPNKKQVISNAFYKYNYIFKLLNHIYSIHPDNFIFKKIPHYPLVFKSWNAFNEREINKILNSKYLLDDTEFYKIASKIRNRTPMYIKTILISKVWEPHCAYQKAYRNIYQGEKTVSFPFTDYEFFNFFSQHHFSLSQISNKNKVLIRKHLELNLPDEIVRKKKGSFVFDSYSLLKYNNNQLINENLTSDFVKTIGIHDTKLLDHLIKQHNSGNRESSRKLFALVALSRWYYSVHLKL